jgi:hypothetical protein
MIFKQMYSGGGEFVLNITSSVAGPNIPALATAAGWNGSGFLKVNITAAFVNTLVISNSWNFPSGLEVEISAGTLIGGWQGSGGNPPAAGGTALIVQVPVSIRNNGTIAGGGGQGGFGQIAYVDYNSSRVIGGTNGNLGAGQGFASGATTPVSAQSGGAGIYAEYTGPLFGGDTRPWAQGGNSGTGGGWGTRGNTGSYGSIGGSYDAGGELEPPTIGGAPGNSVVGNSFITWLATGTRLGPISA